MVVKVDSRDSGAYTIPVLLLEVASLVDRINVPIKAVLIFFLFLYFLFLFFLPLNSSMKNDFIRPGDTDEINKKTVSCILN